MPTEAALEFVGKATFEALSGNPVSTSVFERVPEVNHVRQAELADAIVIAPATADLMSQLAAGRCDDLLSATVLTTHAPVIMAPRYAHSDVGTSSNANECAGFARTWVSRN